MSRRKIKTIKFIVLGALCLLDLFLIYISAGAFYGWRQQPEFIGADGALTRSYGFLVVAGICAGLMLLSLLTTGLYAYFAFFRKKKRTKKAAPEEPAESEKRAA